jgi:hypothetical protein
MKREDTYDRVPTSSLDVRKHPRAWETAQVALPRESLIQYAVALELQYSRICMSVGTARRREAADIAWRIVGLLGLTQAAEPLPHRLLILLERQSR